MAIVAYLWTTKKYLPTWLEQQKEELQRYAGKHKVEVVGQVIESRPPRVARLKQWPKLMQVVAMAKQHDATLIIPRLHRLVKSPSFLKILRDHQVEFKALDFGRVSQRTIETFIQAAEEAERAASQRQKDALAAAKEAGTKLGSARRGHWKGREHLRGQKKATIVSAQNRSLRAKEAYKGIEQPMLERVAAGWSYQAIADWLTIKDHLTTAGKPFTGTAVWRIVQRLPSIREMKPEPQRAYKPPIKLIQKLAEGGMDPGAISKQLAKEGYALPDGHVFTATDVQKIGRLELTTV
jgi:DNA invertase Pin-like site-specific DNA recombinase